MTQYAGEYCELLQDSAPPAFPHRRNWELLCRFMRGADFDPGVSSWLDVGCGRGDLLRLGGSCFKRAAGCGHSASTLPHRSNQFDLVTAVCVFGEVAPARHHDLMIEISRVLRPEGIACIIEQNPLNPATLLRRPSTHVNANRLTAGSVSSLLRDSGLTSPRVEYFRYLPESLYGKVPMIESLLSRVPAGGSYAVFAGKQVPAILKSGAKARRQSNLRGFFSYGPTCAT